MPIKSIRFKCLVDEESQSFVLHFWSKGGIKGDPQGTRTITLRTWDQVQATVELARRGLLESNAEVMARIEANKPPILSTETVEDYLARGGKITKVEFKKAAPAVDDWEAWEDILDDIAHAEHNSPSPNPEHNSTEPRKEAS